MSLRCVWLGRAAYTEALALQEDLAARVRRGEAADTLLLLEHPAVITLGRTADPGNVLVSDAEREARGIELHDAGRGGDVTFHGPGQLVGYPVLSLRGERRDAHRYLRDLEAGIIDALGELGIASGRVHGLTGVWTGGAKIAAIGVRIGTGWVTSHGFSLNVGRDLSGFGLIVPCGLTGRPVTSVSHCLGRDLSPEQAAPLVGRHVARALGYAADWDGALSSSVPSGGRL